LRNIALQARTGKYVAQWDDDDWYSPARLTEQMAAIRKTGKRGCLLARWTLYDCLTKRAYVSNVRPWEGSIVVERAILPMYPDVAMREDTPVVVELNRQGQLTLLDRPELYIYTYHGMNTWDRHHWEQILNGSQPLGVEISRQVTALLGIETQGAVRFPTFTSDAILDSIAAFSEKTPVTETKNALLPSCDCETRGSLGEPGMARPHRRWECLPAWEWNG
jgi:hypothetical protein